MGNGSTEPRRGDWSAEVHNGGKLNAAWDCPDPVDRLSNMPEHEGVISHFRNVEEGYRRNLLLEGRDQCEIGENNVIKTGWLTVHVTLSGGELLYLTNDQW